MTVVPNPISLAGLVIVSNIMKTFENQDTEAQKGASVAYQKIIQRTYNVEKQEKISWWKKLYRFLWYKH